MSLDIHLFKLVAPDGVEVDDKNKVNLNKLEPEEVASMNWLRNPFGLCNWAEDNFEAVGAKTDTKLSFVINNWSYETSNDINRELFKSVVDGYWKVLQKIDKGYFFFDIYSYLQFIEPNRKKLPTEHDNILGIDLITGMNWKLSKVGIPMEHFTKKIIDIDNSLDHYKDWFNELVEFSNKLQDKKLIFYCSN